MKLILLGAPGAGKGTQADIISNKLEIPIISTGNILRAAVRDGTPIGLRAKDLIEAGKLIPDDVIIGIVAERLEKDDCKNGYILDGVPRTLGQADALEDAGISVDKVVLIDVPDETIERRMVGRRTCSRCSHTYHVEHNPPEVEGVCDICGGELIIRKDDLPETVKNRLSVYHRETEPLIRYYEDKGMLVRVDGKEKLSKTTQAVFKALGIEE